MGEIARLQQIIDESRNLVFFGGAGVSQKVAFLIFEV